MRFKRSIFKKIQRSPARSHCLQVALPHHDSKFTPINLDSGVIGISEAQTLACERAMRMQEKLPQDRYLSDHLIARRFSYSYNLRFEA